MNELPINEVLQDIKSSLKIENTLILQAPPGAGKSTRVPISLLDESWLRDKIIIMLEPRRVAARMVAEQMASLLGEEVGQRVGYQVKMDSAHSKETKILVLTEAILIRKLQANQTLDDVAMIIFDEFHERSIHTDLSLALSLQVQELLREDLKLLIMSATLNASHLLSLLGEVPVISSKGRSFDIEYKYLDVKTPQPNFKTLNSTLHKTVLSALKEESGDILVFLAGVKEILKLQKSLQESQDTQGILILPLYSTLVKKEQDRALQKNSKRKIILSTNIAQTSVTIVGVSVVVDSGLEKLSRYHYSNAMNHLELSFISQDAATQRAGRAGRINDGVCYRLWHKPKILQESTRAEILRTDLSSLLLDLALWGVDDLNEMKFLDIPSSKVIDITKELLYELEMLDENYKITKFGEDALHLGLHPRFAYMILKANELGFAYEASLLAALLSEKDIFNSSYRDSDLLFRFTHLFHKDFETPDINRFRAKEVLKQADFFYTKLTKIKKVKKKNSHLDENILPVLLLLAYPDRLAKQRTKNDNRYKLSNSKGAILNIEENLFNEEYLVVASLNAHETNSYITLALAITLEQIESNFTSLVKTRESISYNKENKKFDVRESKYFLDLELFSKPIKLSSEHNLVELLLQLIRNEGLELLPWNKKARNLQERVNFLHHHEDFEEFSDAVLLESLEEWLKPYLENIKSIKDLENLDLYSILLAKLSWQEQQELDKLLPKHIQVPSGSNILIDYSDAAVPSLSVKIQELFGLYETPRVLNNTIALQIHLLNPAMKPIQITYDLKSFWKNSYAEVRKELRGKYKRHYWPENPYEAEATTKTKKHLDRIARQKG